MNAKILTGRMLRALETDCSFADGVALATEYNAAVENANVRLDAIVASIEKGEVSDAVRLLDESPRVLDMVNALDFARLAEWTAFCSRAGFAAPLSISRRQLDRVLQFSEGTDVVEPALKHYRRASRLGDQKLALQSLRHLVDKDQSQDWHSKLEAAELLHAQRLAEEFAQAQSAKDAERVLEIALEVEGTKWLHRPTGHGVERIHEFLSARERARLESEAEENIAILKKCVSENWNRPLALAMIEAMDRIFEKGVLPASDIQTLLDDCRTRCQSELEAEEKERRWKELRANLHAAIERESPDAVREALAAPEFLDREPSEDLLRAAQDVLDHDVQMKRRKAVLMTLCVCVTVVAVLVGAGVWFKKRMFTERCQAEVARLETLKNGAYAIERLGEALTRLKQTDAEVYARPEVAVYEQTRASMIQQNLVRTNELVSLLGELSGFHAAAWKDQSAEAITSRFARVKQLLKPEDLQCRKDYAELKSEWDAVAEKRAEQRRADADRFQRLLVESMRRLTAACQSGLATSEVWGKLGEEKAAYAEWETRHRQYTTTNEVESVYADLLAAEKKQIEFTNMVARLNGAVTAKDIVTAREALRNSFARFDEVMKMGDYPCSVADVAGVVAKTSSRQQIKFKDPANAISEEAFRKFLEESVAVLSEFSVYYNLWIVERVREPRWRGDDVHVVPVAVSMGKPKESKGKIYSDAFLDISKRSMATEVSKSKSEQMRVLEMGMTEEVKEFVDAAKSPKTRPFAFRRILWKWVKAHFDSEGVERSPDDASWQNYYPAYRRIMMVDMYIGWMKEMKCYPDSRYFTRLAEKVGQLASPISIADIPEDIAWICYWEKRVQDRNEECRAFLKANRKSFATACDAYTTVTRRHRKEALALGAIGSFDIVDAGVVLFRPGDPKWRANPSLAYIHTYPNVSSQAPLYVLRRAKNGDVVLKQAFRWSKNPLEAEGGWKYDKQSVATFAAGEPLFQVESNGARIDAEVKIKELAKESEVSEEDLRAKSIFD